MGGHTTAQRLGAEFLGTFWLVFGGCGSAVLAAGDPRRRHRVPGRVAGLRPHRADDGVRRRARQRRPLQPRGDPRAGDRAAVRVEGRPGLRRDPGGRGGRRRGGAVGRGQRGRRASAPRSRASPPTGTATARPEGYSLLAVLVIEVVLTAFFLYVILGATDTRAPKGFAPIAHRPRPDPDPPGQHPGQQHLGEPGPLHRPGAVRRERRDAAALGVLAGAAGRGRDRRGELRHAARQRRGARARSRRPPRPDGADGGCARHHGGRERQRRRRSHTVGTYARHVPTPLEAPCRPPAVSPPSARACSSPSA